MENFSAKKYYKNHSITQASPEKQKERSSKVEIRFPCFSSNRSQKFIDKYLEHDKQWKVPKNQYGCELNHQNFFGDKKLKNFTEKKSVIVFLASEETKEKEKNVPVSEHIFKRMLKFLQNYQEDSNISNDFNIIRKFQRSNVLNSNDEVFSFDLKTYFKMAILKCFLPRSIHNFRYIDLQIPQKKSFQLCLRNFHRKYQKIQKYEDDEIPKILKKDLDIFLKKVAKFKTNLDDENLDSDKKALHICLQELEQGFEEEIFPPLDFLKCRKELISAFLKEINSLDLEKLEAIIKKFNSSSLCENITTKIYNQWKEFNKNNLKDLLEKKSDIPFSCENLNLTDEDFDSYNQLSRDIKSDCSNRFPASPEGKKLTIIRKIHFWHTFKIAFKELEEFMESSSNETQLLITRCFLYKSFLKQKEMMEKTAQLQNSPDTNYNISEKEVQNTFNESNNFPKLIMDCTLELEGLYSEFATEFQEILGKIADGEMSNLIFWKRLNFTSDTWYSALHPIIAGIFKYYEKLQIGRKEETDSSKLKNIFKEKEDFRKKKTYYNKDNLPKITLINFDGFDNPLNYYFANSLTKNLQIISITINGEREMMTGLETSMKCFNRSIPKKNFISVPLRPYGFKNKFKIKSKDFLKVFNTIIFKLIENHKPSMIVISHSFSFCHTINPENNINLNPGTFSKIIEKLAILSNYKLILFPNINLKDQMPKTDVLYKEYKYDNWQANFCFKDTNHLLENRRYIYEMIGAFINTLNGKI